MRSTKRFVVVCGPTASGKSDLADGIAEALSARNLESTPTLIVDSMQAYREIPVISNQARKREAYLTGITSVTEEWNVARHREAAQTIISGSGSADFVLDAGTGMYLNAMLFDLDLAPKVQPKLRERARSIVASEGPQGDNERRRIRETELDLSKADVRGSIWSGALRFDTDFIYLRTPKDHIAAAIERRTERIINSGIEEVKNLREISAGGETISPQVLGAIGVREISRYLDGLLTLPETRQEISRRTKALAKRQITWFDKLSKILQGRANSITAESAASERLKHYMHDILEP